MVYFHKQMASGGWQKFSLVEQMGNIGSEVFRSIKWFKLKDDRFNDAFERALELFDLTLEDNRWKGRRKEIARSREIFCSLMIEPEMYDNLYRELDSLDNYFFQFGMAARLQREKRLKDNQISN